MNQSKIALTGDTMPHSDVMPDIISELPLRRKAFTKYMYLTYYKITSVPTMPR